MRVWRLITHHADKDGALFWFKQNSRIAIGWGAIGDIRDDTMRYIQSQKEHHAVHSFSDELIAFLDKHGTEYEKWMLD
jgi:hypothetical protein